MSFLNEEANAVADSTIVMRMFADYENVLSTHRDLLSASTSSNAVQRRLNLEATELTDASILEQSLDNVRREIKFKKDNDQSKRRLSDAGMISANCKIARLEMKVSEMETSSDESKIFLEKQIEHMRLEQQHDRSRIVELESLLVRAVESETETKEELVEIKRKFESELDSLSAKLKKVENERDEIKEKYDEETSQLHDALFTLENDSNRLQLEKENLESELECTEEKINHLTDKATEYERLLNEEIGWNQQREMMALQIKQLESDLNKSTDDIELSKILRKQVCSLPELENENRKLKEDNRLLRMRDENVLLLKEKLKSAEDAVGRLEQRSGQLSKLQTNNDALRAELAEWKEISLVGQLTKSRSAQQVTEAIAQLQQQHSVAVMQMGELNTSNLLTKKNNEQLKEELSSVKMKCQQLEAAMKQNNEHMRHLQRKMILVTKERDVNRQLLDSYQKDMTLNVYSNERLSKLEAINEQYRTAMELLEQDLKSARKQLGFKDGAEFDESSVDSRVKSMKERISELESQVSELIEVKKSLELRLEFETVKGDYNPMKTQIVHLKSNPASWLSEEKVAEFNQLKKENASLKERVKLLEEEGAKAADVTLRINARLEQGSPEQVIEDLKKQLVSADVQKDRVKETFKRFSSEIREVTYMLLGYKLEQPCNKKYKLTSIYADSVNDYLLFGKSEEGSMQLLETPYSAYLADKIELYLHKCQSIPAFLSSITIELSGSQNSTLNL
ncbi:Mitotic spindle assembly checkpoint protein MAD1 [Chamberlinius hualienensis]